MVAGRLGLAVPTGGVAEGCGRAARAWCCSRTGEEWGHRTGRVDPENSEPLCVRPAAPRGRPGKYRESAAVSTLLPVSMGRSPAIGVGVRGNVARTWCCSDMAMTTPANQAAQVLENTRVETPGVTAVHERRRGFHHVHESVHRASQAVRASSKLAQQAPSWRRPCSTSLLALSTKSVSV